MTGERAIRVVFGNSGDTIQVRFERLALERFVHLAVDLLAVPLRDDDPDYEAPAITSPAALMPWTPSHPLTTPLISTAYSWPN